MPCLGSRPAGELRRRSRRKGRCLIHSSSQSSRALVHQARTQRMHRGETLSKRDRWELSKRGLERKLDPAFVQPMSDQVDEFSEARRSSLLETVGFSTTTLQVPDALGEPSQTFPKNPEHVETNLFLCLSKARGAAFAWDTEIRWTEPRWRG